jgi:hypothetical protein
MDKENCGMKKKKMSFSGIVAVTVVTAAMVLGVTGCGNPAGSEDTPPSRLIRNCYEITLTSNK